MLERLFFFSALKLIAQTINLMNQSEKGVHLAT